LLLVPAASKQGVELAARMQYNFTGRMAVLSNTRFHCMPRVRDNWKPGSTDIPLVSAGFETNMYSSAPRQGLHKTKKRKCYLMFGSFISRQQAYSEC
jgi:hypothetical protein